MTIKSKITLSFLILGLIPMIFIGIFSIVKASGALHTEATHKLNAIEHQKKTEIINFFKDCERDADFFKTRGIVTEALQDLSRQYARAAQKGITGNRLLRYDIYKNAAAKYHESFTEFVHLYDYYDIFLFSAEGKILLTAAEESDFGTDLQQTNSHLTRVWAKAVKSRSVQISDMAPYTPSGGEAAIFVVDPIIVNGSVAGAIGFRVSVEAIDHIMSQTSGLGETGEVYLVGQDMRLRSDSSLHPKTHTVHTSFKDDVKIETHAAHEALKGKDHEEILEGYYGKEVLSSYSPIHITKDLTWAIISEVTTAEIFSAVNHLKVIVIIIFIVIAAVVIAAALFIGGSINKGIKTVIESIGNITENTLAGRLDERIDEEGIIVDFKALVNQLNTLLDAYADPIAITVDYLENFAEGNFPEPITKTYNGDFNKIKIGINNTIESINNLNRGFNDLVDKIIAGKLTRRANTDNVRGEYQKIILGLNQILNVLTGFLDAVPLPVMMIDKEYNITYLNTNGCKVVNKSQTEVIGKKCFDQFKTQECNTPNCALAKAMASGQEITSETIACPTGKNMDILYTGNSIHDKDGNVAGALEIVVDQTAIKTAQRLAGKIAGYQNTEVDKLAARLDLLAKGDLKFETTTEKTDADTRQVGENFLAINSGLAKVKNALNHLIADIDSLVKASLGGELNTRADATTHQGAYSLIVGGINNILEAVINPITEAMDVMDKMAAKDLTRRVLGKYKGDLHEFKSNINLAADNLQSTIASVETAAEQVSAGATQISSGSQSLAEGSSEQASSIEEVTASLEELLSLTLSNADNAKSAGELSNKALSNVEDGGKAMGEMSNAMESINKSAEQTGKIIKTIDEIAFQTNLLALNAAVEAAHAGEAGKGFAVVAEEVKNLALRSAEAARNTNDLIEESLKNSENGAQIVKQVISSFGEIEKSFVEVNNIVKEISTSSDEQATGLKQINAGVSELNKLTQQNAANAEESASSSEEMSSQAETLRAMISEFTLNTNGSDRRQKLIGTDKPDNMYEVNPQKVLPLNDVNDDDFVDF